MSEERTEQATEQRKREARRKGQVVKSQELVSAVTLAVGVGVLYRLLPTLTTRGLALFRGLLASAGANLDIWVHARRAGLAIAGLAASALLPVMLLAAAAGALTQLALTGFAASPGALAPNLKKLNPAESVKRWFSKRTLVEAVKLVLKSSLAILLCWQFWQQHGHAMLSATAGSPHRFALVWGLVWKLVWLQVAFGGADFAYNRWEHKRNLMMTKQEVKDENKRQDGDPRLKGERRARGRRMLKNAGANRLEEARVVVTNPTHYAVALKYELDMTAPVVVAKGADLVAAEIKRRAVELGIPTVEDVPLARALFKLDIEASIPPALFHAVAEILLAVTRAEDYL